MLLPTVFRLVTPPVSGKETPEVAQEHWSPYYSPITSRNEKMLFKVEQHKPCGGQELWLDF